MRRIRIFVRPRTLEDVAALDALPAEISCLAADAHHLLGAPVQRFEFVVGDAPVLNRQVRGQLACAVLLPQHRRQPELVREITIREAAPMLARPAHARAGVERSVLPHGNRRRAHGMTVSDRLIGQSSAPDGGGGPVSTSSMPVTYSAILRSGPRSSTTTEREVRLVISLAIARPTQPPPAITISARLRRCMAPTAGPASESAGWRW